jgi:hypothetical protein
MTERAELLSTVDPETVWNVPKSLRLGRLVARPRSRRLTIHGERLTVEQHQAADEASWPEWLGGHATLQARVSEKRVSLQWWLELDDLLGRHWTDTGQIVDALRQMTPDDYTRAVELLELCDLLDPEEAPDGD